MAELRRRLGELNGSMSSVARCAKAFEEVLDKPKPPPAVADPTAAERRVVSEVDLVADELRTILVMVDPSDDLRSTPLHPLGRLRTRRWD